MRVWLRLSGLMNNSDYGCRTARRRHGFTNCGSNWRAGASSKPLLPGRRPCADEHRAFSHGRRSPSTTSVHLGKLKNAHLVNVLVQGKHRFYSLAGPDVARALEGLSVLAGSRRDKYVSNAPTRLRVARTCYDHMAGMVGVLLHDGFQLLKWLSAGDNGSDGNYELTVDGKKAIEGLGIEVEPMRALRHRFACPCLDWSERSTWAVRLVLPCSISR
jgi:hypothetical protein